LSTTHFYLNHFSILNPYANLHYVVSF